MPQKISLTLPGSKSLTNRALLLAALARGTSQLTGVLEAADTLAMINALETLGVSLKWDQKRESIEIIGQEGNFSCAAETKINCHDAGTVARFLLATTANQKGSFYFTGSQHLNHRPHAALLDSLRQLGATTHPENADTLPLTITNTKRLHGGHIYLNASASSQYLSALLMIAPYCAKTLTITAEKLTSSSYVKMTIALMETFGVKVAQLDQQTFRVDNTQFYQARNYTIEPDLSTASYFFAAAALTKSEFTLTQINPYQTLQGDRQFLAVLEQMGCQVRYTNQSITFQGTSPLSGITVDMNGFSDTFITLAVLAPFAAGPVTIKNIQHTRYQESDRIAAVVNNLRQLGINCQENLDGLTIFPGSIKNYGILHSYNDHRIAMAFSLLQLKIPDIMIDDVHCVNKTCPTYFELMQSFFNN